MDLNQAGQTHSEWKIKLRMAIAKQEALDAARFRPITNACLANGYMARQKENSAAWLLMPIACPNTQLFIKRPVR